MCQDMVLEHREPGAIPLYGEVPLYDGLVGGLAGGKLQRVVLELLGLERGFFSLVHLHHVGLLRWLEGLCLFGLAESLVNMPCPSVVFALSKL